MLTPTQIEKLNTLITDGYGTPERVAQRLHDLVFMLHYLEEEVFSRREVQSAADLLRSLGEVLCKST
ncbi:hypothetical protein [Flagellimonas flava]|uniref:Uncharacterized protein n=1 Tax=Flagellimonas flava TaxID=570519 RepID=A0A1M5KKA1_9FLAO|nr:hypothetical protein [Allomuricauda flava]SHG53100.1 hypothetical protein SAMN04488116_1630 [Allomuricauda flava]